MIRIIKNNIILFNYTYELSTNDPSYQRIWLRNDNMT